VRCSATESRRKTVKRRDRKDRRDEKQNRGGNEEKRIETRQRFDGVAKRRQGDENRKREFDAIEVDSRFGFSTPLARPAAQAARRIVC